MNWPWRHWSGRARAACLLALFLVAGFAPLVAAESSQPASRIALTAALAEHHTVDIHGYPLGIDRATYNGHLRSDKAPGQPLLAVPVYLVGRALGAQSAAHLRQNGNLGLWWVTLWTEFLPFVALVALMYLFACRYAPPGPALAVAVGLGACTMMLPQSVNLYGEALAALTAYAAWTVLEARPRTATWLVVAGALAGASVAAEYETAIVLAVLGVLAIRMVQRRAAWFALGASVPLLVVAWYDTVAFGRPWRTAHAYYATPAIRRSFVGYTFPSWHGIDATFFGSHSLLLTNSIVLVALAAAVMMTRSPNVDVRRHAIVALVIAVPYLLLCIMWKAPLEEPGPRYMIPALPFLVVPLASAWSRLRQIALVAIGLSAVVAIGAATTGILTPKQQQVLPAVVRRAANGRFLPTVWSMAFGRLGILIYVVSVLAAGGALVLYLRSRASGGAATPVAAGRRRPEKGAELISPADGIL